MPKLAAEVARHAEEAAQEGGPQPIPEGVYVGRLHSVEISEKEGPSGHHYWTWIFKLQDEGYQNREQRLITSLSPAAAFAVGGAFAAFGVPADTDTDELLGRLALLKVTQGVIQSGSRQGEVGNRVQYLMPYDGPVSETSPLDQDF